MVNHLQHVHHHLHEARDNGVATAVQVVYVTAQPTFSGPIASYVTPSQDQIQAPPATQVSSMPAVVAAPSSSIDTAAIPTSIVASSADASSAVSGAASSGASSMASSSQATSSISQAPSSTSPTGVHFTPAPTTANADSLSSSAAPSATPTSQGMSTGAQAGLAIGLLALAVIIITGAFFIYRARKNKAQKQAQKIDDEKSPFGGNQSMTTSSVAPRLSLGNGLNGKGGLMTPVPAVTRDSDNEKANPFGDHARLPEAKLPTLDDPTLAPKPLNVSRPGSPDKEQQAAAGAAPRAGSPTQTANVHRVQLDFNPSMDDELELRQGQLVRMLHEYDDGWCLCIRLDRSQQGVVPRSCVSKNPVKPRPAPGPNGGAPGSPRTNGPPPAARPLPAGNRARSNSSAPRPVSPPQGPFGEGQYRVRSNTVDSKPASIVSADSLSGSPNHASPESGSPTLPPAKMAPGQAV